MAGTTSGLRERGRPARQRAPSEQGSRSPCGLAHADRVRGVEGEPHGRVRLHAARRPGAPGRTRCWRKAFGVRIPSRPGRLGRERRVRPANAVRGHAVVAELAWSPREHRGKRLPRDRRRCGHSLVERIRLLGAELRQPRRLRLLATTPTAASAASAASSSAPASSAPASAATASTTARAVGHDHLLARPEHKRPDRALHVDGQRRDLDDLLARFRSCGDVRLAAALRGSRAGAAHLRRGGRQRGRHEQRDVRVVDLHAATSPTAATAPTAPVAVTSATAASSGRASTAASSGRASTAASSGRASTAATADGRRCRTRARGRDGAPSSHRLCNLATQAASRRRLYGVRTACRRRRTRRLGSRPVSGAGRRPARSDATERARERRRELHVDDSCHRRRAAAPRRGRGHPGRDERSPGVRTANRPLPERVDSLIPRRPPPRQPTGSHSR